MDCGYRLRGLYHIGLPCGDCVKLLRAVEKISSSSAIRRPAPAADVPPPPAADSSPDYHTAEGELMLSESEEERIEEERIERTHTKLEDVQRCAESAAACLQAFRTATCSYRYEFF